MSARCAVGSGTRCLLAVDRGVFGGQPRSEAVDQHAEHGRIGCGYAARCGGDAHLPGPVGIVVAEDLRGCGEVAGSAVPPRHDQREAGSHDPAGGSPAEGLARGAGGGFGGPLTPALKSQAEVAVGLAGEERGGTVAGQLRGEVVAQQRSAQAGDEEAEVVAFEFAQQHAHAEQEDASAIDLGEGEVERGLDRIGVGPVDVGGLMAKGKQQVEVGYSGDRRAAQDAAVEIGTMQPPLIECRGNLRASGGDHRREHTWHPAQRALAPDQPVLVQPSLAHWITLPCTRAAKPAVKAASGSEVRHQYATMTPGCRRDSIQLRRRWRSRIPQWGRLMDCPEAQDISPVSDPLLPVGSALRSALRSAAAACWLASAGCIIVMAVRGASVAWVVAWFTSTAASVAVIRMADIYLSHRHGGRQ